MSEPEQKVCPRCGERFECRLSAGCWCAEYPVVSHVEPQSDCLCPQCLKKTREREKEGFTLVELLVVIAIMAILAAEMHWHDNTGQSWFRARWTRACPIN